VNRRKTATIVFVSLCVVLVAAAVTLNIGWIIVNGRRVLPLVLGILSFALIIAGIIVYTVFLVREIRRNDQHDAFINAVTHELKTPIASIRLYLETLQAREVSDVQRREFYRVMLADADRLQQTVEQVLKAGVAGQRAALQHRAPVDIAALAAEVIDTARRRHHLPPETMQLSLATPATGLLVDGDSDELRTVLSNLLDNAVKYSRDVVQVMVEVAAPSPVGARQGSRRRDSARAVEAHLQPLLPLSDARLQSQRHRPRPLHRPLHREAAWRTRVRRQRRRRQGLDLHRRTAAAAQGVAAANARGSHPPG
jgi:signal transduction histidine kinase